ncbi:MAG: cytochrome c [Caldilineaceae bacterium]
MRLGIKFWLCICLLLLAGCGGEEPKRSAAADLDPFADSPLIAWEAGDPAAGRALFEQKVLAAGAGCVTCHSLEPDVTLVGPSLYGVADRAQTRQSGVLAPNYLYLSIVAPDQHVVEGFADDLMPETYATALTEEQLANLVSFLMTLKGKE